MSVADAETDRLCDAIVIVAQSRGRIVRTVALSLIFLVFYAGALFVFVRDLLRLGLSAEVDYSPFLITTILLSLFIHTFGLIYVCKPALAIFKSRLELSGQAIAWASIGSCHWNRYSPGKLMVATDVGKSHALHSVLVPGGQRAAVEVALRRSGKWDVRSRLD
jgi:hypothetical protein